MTTTEEEVHVPVWSTLEIDDEKDKHYGLVALYCDDDLIGYYRTKEDAEADVP